MNPNDESPTEPEAPAEPTAPTTAREPNKKLWYGIVGGVIAVMVIALGVHLVSTNPPPAKTAGYGTPPSPSFSNPGASLGVPDDIAARRAAFNDSPISTTLSCTGGGGLQGIVSIFSAGAGSPITTKWSGLSDSIRRGPTVLYLTMVRKAAILRTTAKRTQPDERTATGL